jgi:hypothetical protein
MASISSRGAERLPDLCANLRTLRWGRSSTPLTVMGGRERSAACLQARCDLGAESGSSTRSPTTSVVTSQRRRSRGGPMVKISFGALVDRRLLLHRSHIGQIANTGLDAPVDWLALSSIRRCRILHRPVSHRRAGDEYPIMRPSRRWPLGQRKAPRRDGQSNQPASRRGLIPGRS